MAPAEPIEPIEITPEDRARALYIIGNIHLQNDRPGEARDYYRKLLEKHPQSTYARYARSRLAEMDAPVETN